ncbi:MAG: DHHA1 domain-containing protein [Nitrososphaerota archaeon]
MSIIITHNDADGIISAASVFLKHPEKFSLYFATPNLLKTVFCKCISKHEMEEKLFVLDLSPNKEALRLASFFDDVTWIDHHIWDVSVSSPIKGINDVNSPSTARICANYFQLSQNKIFDWADEIDRNDVKSVEGEYLRDLVDGIKFVYGKGFHLKFKHLATLLSKDPESIMNEENDKIVEKFREWLKEVENRVEREIKIFNSNDKKIGLYTTNKAIPTRIVLKKVKELGISLDVLAVLYYHIKGKNIFTKVELRTLNNFDVYEIAKRLGGGGHKYASGATVEGFLKIDDFMKFL